MKIMSLLSAILLSIILLACGSIPMVLDPTRSNSDLVVSREYNFLEKRKVAVLPFTSNHYQQPQNETVADFLSIKLMKLGFVIIERAKIEAVLKEHKLEISNITIAANISKIGKLLGVDYIVLGTLNYDYSVLRTAQARFVDVGTGEIVIFAKSYANRRDEEFVAEDIYLLLKQRFSPNR